MPGLRSSRIYVIDTKPDPRNPKFHKIIEPEELIETTGYSRPHTVHCGPGGIYVTALGSAEGGAPGGIFLLDPQSFEPLGRWEVDRGPQQLAYDGWWHLGYDTLVTSEWGTPDTFENGLIPEVLSGGRYGRKLHFWDLTRRRHLQEIDFGPEYQLVFELRPAHDPTRAYGFVNCVISLKDLSSSIWVWHRDGNAWAVRKIIDIPAEPASADVLPPVLQSFGAVPPLVTDIDLSLDDRFLYVSCWGTGDLLQYDVSDPFTPKLTGKVRIGGIVSRAPHPAAQDNALRKDFEGKPVELIGQLMPDATNNASGKRLKAVRMFMTCCAADARPVAVLAESETKPGLPEMSWIKITGTATFPVENGRRIAVLKADKVEKCNPPEETMLY